MDFKSRITADVSDNDFSNHLSGRSDLSKIVMSLVMLTGRLENFPILILFSPSTWRK